MSNNIGFKKVLKAFLVGTDRRLKNDETFTNYREDGTELQRLRYHGNTIAYYLKDEPGTIFVSLAGWGTVSTRARLNEICRATCIASHGFYQSKHIQYAATDSGDHEIGEDDWLVIDKENCILHI